MQLSCHPFFNHFGSRGVVLGSCWHESAGLISTRAPAQGSRHTVPLGPCWLYKHYDICSCSIPNFTASQAQLMLKTHLPGFALLSGQEAAVRDLKVIIASNSVKITKGLPTMTNCIRKQLLICDHQTHPIPNMSQWILRFLGIKLTYLTGTWDDIKMVLLSY